MDSQQKTNPVIINHPLIEREVTILRNKYTQHEQFRSAVKRIATLLAAEIMKYAEYNKINVETPLETTSGVDLRSQVILAPVLRAGLGMVSGFLALIPEAKVSHIGIQRNEETLEPVVYYAKAPQVVSDSMIILLDPMLATGGSSDAAITFLKKKGSKNIVFACLVASPEGVALIQEKHPDVKIFAAAYDRCLNERGYILPGLGDAGDRMFGTL
ncbi:MAG: uracil phosphoribosyltransferase [Ignavibacteria bacterium]|nr:uracil phosphoribosyltransferase [Ignavibacteria bacterium]